MSKQPAGAAAPATAAAHEYKTIPLALLHESVCNPRKTFDTVRLQELVESIKVKGIITPLLVRPHPDGPGYEIAAGHRRFRASHLVGLAEVPVIIREMSDLDFLELLTVENLHHDDLSPLEEAEAYQALLDAWRAGRQPSKDDIARLAERVGKSTSYIYGSLKLRELAEAPRKALLDGEISASHAVLIARLPASVQPEILEETFEMYGMGGDAEPGDREACSVRELSEIISSHFVDLKGAPFSKEDVKLFPLAGSCTTCPKRTANDPALSADLGKKRDLCTDRGCYNLKVAALVDKRVKLLTVDGKGPKKISENWRSNTPGVIGQGEANQPAKCSSAVEAVWVDGRNAGKTVMVCVDPKCKTHRRHVSNATGAPDYAAQERARQAKSKVEKALRLEILRRLSDVVVSTEFEAPSPKQALEAVLLAIWTSNRDSSLHEAAEFLGWKPGKDVAKELSALAHQDLWRVLVVFAVASDLHVNYWEVDTKKPYALLSLARLYKVDVAKIDRELKEAAKAAAKKPAAAKKKAAAPAPAKKEAKPVQTSAPKAAKKVPAAAPARKKGNGMAEASAAPPAPRPTKRQPLVSKEV